jgi:hypothetical protein
VVLGTTGVLTLCVVLIFRDALCNVCLANVEREGVVVSGNIRRSAVGTDAVVSEIVLSIGKPRKISSAYDIG